MKKVISVLLLTALLACLCACSVNEQNPSGTNPSTQPCDHEYTEKVTTEATCAEEGVKTFTCSKCKHTYTEAIKTKAHTFASANCTTAKTCVACGATQGKAKGHNYIQGVCKVCSEAQPNYKALTENVWVIAGLTYNEDEPELDVIELRFGKDDMSFNVSFWAPLSSLSEEKQEQYLKEPEKLYEHRNEKYYPLGFGDSAELSYTEEEDTVIFKVTKDGVVGAITMERKDENRYIITEIFGVILDDIVTSCIDVNNYIVAKSE